MSQDFDSIEDKIVQIHQVGGVPVKFLAKSIHPFSSKILTDAFANLSTKYPTFSKEFDKDEQLRSCVNGQGKPNPGALYALGGRLADFASRIRLATSELDDFFKMLPCLSLEEIRRAMKSNDVNSVLGDQEHQFLLFHKGKRYLSFVFGGKQETSPLWSRREQKSVGLCLSGGGYRATLFHLGVLWKLNRERKLQKFDTITGVSGGSITLGVLASQWEELKRRDFVEEAFYSLIVEPIIKITQTNIMMAALAKSFFVNRSKIISDLEELSKGLQVEFSQKLDKLPDPTGDKAPLFVFCACDSYSGEGLYFRYDGVYKITVEPPPEGQAKPSEPANPTDSVHLGIDHAQTERTKRWWSKIPGGDANTVSISEAIAASAAFPLAFNPVEITVEGKVIKAIDGGVFDNFGIDPVLLPKFDWKQRNRLHDIVYLSDAGAPFAQVDLPNFRPLQGLRVTDIIANQIVSLRDSKFQTSIELGHLLGAKCSLENVTDDSFKKVFIANHPGGIGINDEFFQRLSSFRTQLDSFTVAERAILINTGYLSAHEDFSTLIQTIRMQTGETATPNYTDPPMFVDPKEFAEIKNSSSVFSGSAIAKRIPGYSWIYGKERKDQLRTESV
eukprot:TRINITY_DN252_c0_g1_i1.p1 TRINITY_DN252_c0_g1~~TRINITY_DN252_c0_g1_i1.p1  ORF type:complete len:615 (+),score=157.60 TRINITY_DN252_c0_g1_i1:466-2310(+)